MVRSLDSVDWAALTLVGSLELAWCSEVDFGASLDIRLRLKSVDFGTVDVRFEGVTDFNLAAINGLLQVHLFIENIAGFQWENLRYKVSELMDDRLNFYCNAVSWEFAPNTIG